MFDVSTVDSEDQGSLREVKGRLGDGVVLPTPNLAKVFSVESVYYDRPVGYHHSARWQAGHMNEIEEWCAEVRMLIEHGTWWFSIR